MAEVNWELLILIIIIGLIAFAALGIFVGTRISSDKRRIRELEDELTETKKDLEIYRSRVNNHFKKTSELFTQMTDSYRAIYMHLAQGSQDLCTTDAALLKPANEEFLKVTHKEKKDVVQPQSTADEVQEEAATPEELATEPAAAEQTSDMSSQEEEEKAENQEQTPDTLQQEETEQVEIKEQDFTGEQQVKEKTEETAPTQTKAEERKEI